MKRWMAPVLLLAFVAGAVAQSNSAEMTPKPEGVATCWDCHRVVQGNSGPIRTLVDLIPPESAGGKLGDSFEYSVLARNAWSHTQKSLRMTLDLTNAPSIGFASDVPELNEVFLDAIPIEASTLAQPQTREIQVEVPDGETRMDVQLQPASQDDLALLVYPPLYPRSGPPYERVDLARRGGLESFTVSNRTHFNELGYGTWTFIIEARVLPDPLTGTGGALPTPDRTLPFSLAVQAKAEATPERVGSLVTLAQVGAGNSVTVPFRLVVLATPAASETISIRADLWAYYNHDDDKNDDNENVTKIHPVPVLVLLEGTQTILRTEAAPRTTVVRPVNGPTLATASEAVGYAAALLLVFSIVSGGMFGKASRRGLNSVFGTAKRRVAFHNFLSYGILIAAAVHTVLFLIEASYAWTLGLIWGGAASLALLGLGVTGAWQISLIRRWGYGAWRWTHFGLAGAALIFAVVHGLLDGAHFANVQNALGWADPFDARAQA